MLRCGCRIDASPFQARVYERVETHVRERARLACGDVAEEMNDDALGKVVSLDLAVEDELT